MGARRIYRFFFAALLIALFPIFAFAVDNKKCETALGDLALSVNPNEVLEKLNALPPLVLKYDSMREEMKNLRREIQELDSRFSQTEAAEKDLLRANSDPKQAEQRAADLLNSSARDADHLLRQGPPNEKARKLLEGHKMLMKRAQRLEERARHLAEHPEALEEERAQAQEQAQSNDKESGAKQQNGSPSNTQQGQKPSNESSASDQANDKANSNQTQDEGSNSQKEPNSSRSNTGQNKDQKNQGQKNQGQTGKKADANTQSSDRSEPQQGAESNKDGNRANSQQEDQNGKQSQGKKQNQKGTTGAQEERDEKRPGEKPGNQGSEQKKQQGQGQEQSQNQGAGQKQQGQGQGQGKQSSGQKGDQHGKAQSEGQGAQDAGADSSNPSTGQSQGQGKKGQSQPSTPSKSGEGEPTSHGEKDSTSSTASQPSNSNSQSSKPTSEGQPSQSAGKSSGSQTLTQKLSSLLKQIREALGPKAPHQTGEVAEQDTGKKPGETQEQREEQSTKKTENRPTPPKEEAPSSPKDSRFTNQPPKTRPPIKPLDETGAAEVMRRHLDVVYEKTLRQYANSDELFGALNTFRDLCDRLAGEYPRYDFLKQYAARAAELQEKLRLTQVQYRSLEDLGLSVLNRSATSGGQLPSLRFLERLLNELKVTSRLTPEEESVREKVIELISKLESKSKTLTDKELGEGFAKQLLGPLSRDVVLREFPGSSGQDLNWQALASAIRNGQLDDLAIYGRLRSFLDVFEKRVNKPSHAETFSGPSAPINEAEPELQLAQEFDRLAYFHRDGSPPSQDLLRLISGDMLENTFPEKVRKNDPKKPIPKKVTIIVYDVSGSTEGTIAALRNALIQAYVDRSQVEVILKKADHVVYTMAFDNVPHNPERIGDGREAVAYFNRLRAHPIGGSGGTDISAALIATFNKIAEHQAAGGELDRANILLITDGQDQIRVGDIEAARKKIDPKVEIVLNAISLGQSNPDLERIVREQGAGKNGNLGKLSYQYVSTKQIEKILNAASRRQNIEEATKDQKAAADSKPKNDSFMQLKERLIRLDSKRRLEEKLGVNAPKQMKTSFTSARNSAPDYHVENQIALFLRIARSPVAQGWSEGVRAEALQAYIDSLAKEFRSDSDDVIAAISESQRRELLDWMKR